VADEGDVAAAIQAAEIERAIAAHASREATVDLIWCADCGELIPWRRRQLVGGSRCVDCQNDVELRARQVRRR
jgi:phage/conjugal plasmid C-4 type zinc finger TraR family protein